MEELLVSDGCGLACRLGGFHVDPWRPVPLAVITHAHGDHACPGSAAYICAAPGAEILHRRVGPARIRAVPYGERVRLGGVTVSLHPAGHVLGSAQVRIESAASVWVASGDYKRQADSTCAPLEVVPCDVFITESTFALPIYRWPSGSEVAAEICRWWRRCEQGGRTAVLFCYALGKSQRLLAELAAHTDQEVLTHGAIEPLVEAYRTAGARMLPTRPMLESVDQAGRGKRTATSLEGRLVIAPPSASGSPWMRRFGARPRFETGFVSGWMRVRGIRRRRGYDRGFVMSDHADWDGLLATIRETGAKRVLITHGYREALARYLRAQGIEADILPAPYETAGDEQ